MDRLDGSPAQVAGGLLLLGILFVLRELASDALREAGEELQAWGRRRGRKRCRDVEQKPRA